MRGSYHRSCDVHWVRRRNLPSLVPPCARRKESAGEEPNLLLRLADHHGNEHMKLTPSSRKLDRNRVDVSTPVLARYWRKRLRKSQQEIEAAIAKVGGNAETVMKELRAGA